MPEFVHLHLHTQYSLLDGVIRSKQLMGKVKSMGMGAVAVTDHGGMMGVIEFYETANKAGVKPILGVEAYVTPGSRHDRCEEESEGRANHLVLLAENETGYGNLVKMVSIANREGFYYKPRMDKEVLAAHSCGVIAMSACMKGEIPAALLKGKTREAEALLGAYRDIFPGRFYLEVQANGLPEQEKVNGMLVDLARRTDTPLVATGDCHYLEKSDARMHEILLCLQTRETMSSPGRMKYGSDEFYVKSPEEMAAAFSHLPDAVANTVLIASRCNVKLELGVNRIPTFKVPSGKTPEGYLREKAEEGLIARFAEKERRGEALSPGQREEYKSRLAYELTVIENMKFPGYFLIVWDFIRFARERGISVGPGRGSAAGSLVAYSLRITEIDPIPYSLLFERFLNPDRISLPDVDVDFDKDRREEVIEYVREQYGADHVAQIITFGTMKARAAVRDVGRVLEIPYGEVDQLAKLIPAALDMTIEKAIQVEPRLAKAIADDPKKNELFRFARGVEGLVRHASTHAAGVVIGDRPIDEVVPLYRQSDGSITTQFDMKYSEKAGLVKFDFLGLKTLTVIRRALELVKERTGQDVEVASIPMDDKATYELLQAGKTDGVFQAESSGFTDLLVRLVPDRFDHLIDMVALYRPGPLQSGMVDDFVECRHGRRAVKYALPGLEPILKNTYGVILYQEQVMQIAVAIGGFTLGQADSLRKAMGKKIAALMEESRVRFVAGATERGISEDQAMDLFEKMAHFAEYGFNKSHSAAYGYLMYVTSYIKAHWPVEFMTAMLSCEADDGNTEKIIRYIHRCRVDGIPVLPPDVNESRQAFHPSGNSIRFGLTAIKGLGDAALDSVEAVRKDGLFTSFSDFVARIDLRKVNKKAMECLIKAGAFDSLDKNRGALFASVPNAVSGQQKAAKRAAKGQISLFAAEPQKPTDYSGSAWPEKEMLFREKEAIGFYISGHPMTGYRNVISEIGATTTLKVEDMPGGSRVSMCLVAGEIAEKPSRGGSVWGLITAEDMEGIVTLRVFGELYGNNRDLLRSGEPFYVSGRIDENESSRCVVADAILPLSEAAEKATSSAHVLLRSDRTRPEDVAMVREIVMRHPGSKDLVLHAEIPGGVAEIYAGKTYNVSPTLALAAELREALGYEALVRNVDTAALPREGQRGGRSWRR